jgi:5-methylcytosine-specific restriction protein A
MPDRPPSYTPVGARSPAEANRERMSHERRIRGRLGRKRRALWLTMHPLCEPCLRVGRTTEAVEVDHVVAVSAGGRDDETNFESTCRPCHREKTAQERKR